MAVASPASASPLAGSGAVTSASLPPARAVANFHTTRGSNGFWLANAEATRALATVLRRAPIDGFGAGPRLGIAVEQAVAAAARGGEAERNEAERLLSAAWVMYVQALRWPGGGMIFADQSLAPRIPTPEQILADAAGAPSLSAHVAEVSGVNPLYAQLREAALSVGREQHAALQSSLERARLLPAQGRYVLVDLATQQLWMMDGGRPVDGMKVVIGKPDMQTPMIAGTISAATLNPYWNVPHDLARQNIAPQVLRHGAAYLKARGYEVLSDWGAGAAVVAPGSVNWQEVAAGRAEVRIRQKPGPGNMMGAMKFEFPNRHGIYLHDTPDKALFESSQRSFSSGCVRLEDAARLGRWLLGRPPVAEGAAAEQQVALPAPVPVFITYLTARVDNAGLAFAPDIYALDGRSEPRLASRD